MKKLMLALVVSTLFVTAAQAKLGKGDVFPFVTLPALDGKGSIDLAKYKGKVVIVDLWASWCAPCKLELPFLNQLVKTHKGLMVIGVNLDDTRAEANAFLTEHPLEIPLAYDGEKKILVDKAVVEALPTSFLIDKKGRIFERHESFSESDGKKIEAEVALLSKK